MARHAPCDGHQFIGGTVEEKNRRVVLINERGCRGIAKLVRLSRQISAHPVSSPFAVIRGSTKIRRSTTGHNGLNTRIDIAVLFARRFACCGQQANKVAAC